MNINNKIIYICIYNLYIYINNERKININTKNTYAEWN